MQKKILAVLLILTMLLTFAACGGSGSGDTNDGGNQDVNVNVNDGADEEAPKSKRDKTFEISNDYASCVFEYDSSYCDTYDYAIDGETGSAYIVSQGGQATVKLTNGSTSAEDYVEKFKQQKNAGNNSYYYVKDLVVEELHSCEVNGYTYKTYNFSYKDVYVDQNQEYENFGMFGYVQLEGSNALLIEECSYDDLKAFVESALYVKEVVEK